MPYCEKCGKEISEGDKFCTNCGASIRRDVREYRKPRERGWHIGRIIIVVIGFIVLLASFGLLTGGAGIMFVRRNLSDQEGFLMTKPADFKVESYAIVGKEVDFEMDPASQIWIRKPGDFFTLKLVASSNDPSKELFIGIAREADASGYFQDMWYHEVDEFCLSCRPWRGTQPEFSYITHPGESPAAPPIVHSWWTVLSTGTGTQELEWDPDVGNYWIVVMNADGSSEVDVSIRIGAKVPLLRIVGDVLLAGGVVALMIGGALLYIGFIKRS